MDCGGDSSTAGVIIILPRKFSSLCILFPFLTRELRKLSGGLALGVGNCSNFVILAFFLFSPSIFVSFMLGNRFVALADGFDAEGGAEELTSVLKSRKKFWDRSFGDAGDVTVGFIGLDVVGGAEYLRTPALGLRKGGGAVERGEMAASSTKSSF